MRKEHRMFVLGAMITAFNVFTIWALGKGVEEMLVVSAATPLCALLLGRFLF